MYDLIQAKQFDSINDHEKAIEFYEKSLITHSDDLSIYLDLLANYLDVLDFGMISFLQLSEEICNKYSSRMYQLIKLMKVKFGNIPEIIFWEIFINWCYIGDDPQIEQCEKLIKESDYLEPYFHLFNHA